MQPIQCYLACNHSLRHAHVIQCASKHYILTCKNTNRSVCTQRLHKYRCRATGLVPEETIWPPESLTAFHSGGSPASRGSCGGFCSSLVNTGCSSIASPGPVFLAFVRALAGACQGGVWTKANQCSPEQCGSVGCVPSVGRTVTGSIPDQLIISLHSPLSKNK